MSDFPFSPPPPPRFPLKSREWLMLAVILGMAITLAGIVVSTG